MNYSVSLLTNKADCAALISITNADKEILAHKKKGLELQRTSSEHNAVDVDAELASVTAELAALQTILNAMPAGTVKDETLIRFKRADLKKSTLEKRKVSYGVLSLLEKEYDIASLEKDIEEADAFIAAVQVRMDEVIA